MLRGLTILVAAAALLYGGYWFAFRGTAEAALTDAAADLEARGWDVGWDALVTRGFPSRFDTTLAAPRIAAPEAGFAWSAPTLQFLALAYRPTQVIAIFPAEQTLTVAGQTFDVQTEAMRASATVRAAPGLPLRDATVEIGPTRLEGARLDGGFEAGLFALRATDAEPATYDAFGRLTGVTVPPALAQGPLPPDLERVEADALLTFSEPLGRGALAGGLAVPVALDLRHLTLVWGPVSASASGPLATDAEGRLTGSLAVEVEGWRTLLEGLTAAGFLAESPAEALRRAADLAALVDVGALSLELTFEDGQTLVGPVPVGPAPRLYRQ